jgi:hypothetical protein
MKYLYFSLLFSAFGCASDYKGMQKYASDKTCFEKVRPRGLQTNWYTANVDVAGQHLSGLLFIKQMPDLSYRTVFTNEAGVTFFDFEFTSENGFHIHKIIKQLNKKAVITLLGKDFSLLLGKPFLGKVDGYRLGDEIFFGSEQKNEVAYFITDKDCASLRRLEIGSRRKQKVTIMFEGKVENPEHIAIKHHTFNMVINLKKITRG